MEILYALVALAALSAGVSAAPVVSLPDGRVSGVNERSAKGRDFFAYYGIPYAKPPLDKLKLKVREEGRREREKKKRKEGEGREKKNVR